VVRGFFVATTHLPAVIQQRHTMNLMPNVELEDDLLLCTAMDMIYGLTNYLTPFDSDPETLMNKTELPAPFARYVRSDHFAGRTGFCQRAIRAGWTPLSRRVGSPGTPQTPAPISAPARPEFNVNEYWLKRGQTYFGERRLSTETYRLQEQFILDVLNSKALPMGSILEIGCGFGRITRRLAQALPNAQITALGLSPGQLHNARDYCAEYADRIAFQEYDIQSEMPLPGAGYDLAIAVEVLQHHPYDVVLRFIDRLSRIAGVVANYDWSEAWSGPVAPHVWVHDYEEIYGRLGLECEVFVEPRRIGGQQQKLFIASKQPGMR
jgi:SAM-dependent methyltransferase